MDIGPGDIVEAISSDTLNGHTIIRGQLYCVDEMRPGPAWTKNLTCLKCGVKGPAEVIISGMPNAGWCTATFKPIKRRDESLLKSLRQPINLEGEPA